MNEKKYSPKITDFKSLIVTSYNVKYFKEIKHLRSLRKNKAYLEPKRVSMMELFYE